MQILIWKTHQELQILLYFYYPTQLDNSSSWIKAKSRISGQWQPRSPFYCHFQHNQINPGKVLIFGNKSCDFAGKYCMICCPKYLTSKFTEHKSQLSVSPEKVFFLLFCKWTFQVCSILVWHLDTHKKSFSPLWLCVCPDTKNCNTFKSHCVTEYRV